MFLGRLFSKFVREISIVKKRGPGEWGILVLYTDMKKILKRSSPPKPLGQIGPNLAGMFLWRSSPKFVHIVAMATKSNFPSHSLKNPLPWNRSSDLKINSQECPLGDPFQN